MKLVRECIFEKFEEESDAIHDMGIGVSYQTLTPGAILAPTEWLCIGRKSGKIVRAGGGKCVRPGMFLLVLRVLPMMDKVKSINVLIYNNVDLEHVLRDKKDFENVKIYAHQYENKVTMRIPENQFKKRFEIIEKGF